MAMKCWYSPISLTGDQANQACVVVLGFFDGVHLAHQFLINHARNIAREENIQLAVMTFFPHPKEVIDPQQSQRSYLTPMAAKIKIFEQMNVDALYVIRFDKEFASLAPEQFVNEFILPLNPKYIVAGFDFTYGKYGQGNMDSLRMQTLGKVKVVTIDKLEHNGQKISSTLIRQLIQSGTVDRIPQYLGDYYTIYGSVSPSRSTNYRLELKVSYPYMIPLSGFYDVTLHHDKQKIHAACFVDADSAAPNMFIQLSDPFLFPATDAGNVRVKFIKRITAIHEIDRNLVETSSRS